MSSDKKKLCYLVTESGYFLSHRLQLAKAAQQVGYDVYVITRIQKTGRHTIPDEIKTIPLHISRYGRNVISELLTVVRLTKIYKTIRPDIAHHIALKPIVYGTLAALLSRTPHVVNTVAGLGYSFQSKKLTYRWIRWVIVIALKCLAYLKPSIFITQNPEDNHFIISKKIAEKTYLIRGSGVDTKLYTPSQSYREKPTVLLASRMLWSKGVRDFVLAAKHITKKNIPAIFLLAGEPDTESDDTIPISQLQEWHSQEAIQYIGYHDDMPKLLAETDIVCLPTYGEGVPKILIEAASCGIPIVATDVTGCREIVRQNINGYLTPARAPADLVDALEMLLLDSSLRKKMGAAGRRMAQKEFSIDKVNTGTLAIYKDLSEGGA